MVNLHFSLFFRFARLYCVALAFIYSANVFAESETFYPNEPVFVTVLCTDPLEVIKDEGVIARITCPDGRVEEIRVSPSRIWPTGIGGTGSVDQLLLYVDRSFDQPSQFATTGTYVIVVDNQTNKFNVADYTIPLDMRTNITRELLFRISTLNGPEDYTSAMENSCRQILEIPSPNPYGIYAKTFLAAKQYTDRIATIRSEYEGRPRPDLSDMLDAFTGIEPPSTPIGAVYLYHLSRAQAYVDRQESIATLRKLLEEYPVSQYHERALIEVGRADAR